LSEDCKKLGIDVGHTPPRYTQSKGKVERRIRTFNEKFLRISKVFENMEDLMPEFVRWYNYDRYHMGIKFVCLLTCILTVQTLPMSVDITNSTSLYIVKTIHG